MDRLSTLTLVAAVTIPCGLALAVWLFGSRNTRHHLATVRPSATLRSPLTVLVVLGMIAAALTAPIISVLWIVVALNFVLGHREYVPFSTYAMFSAPPRSAWTLRFEDPNGQLVPIGKIGLPPENMRKRFATEVRAARERGVDDISAARHVAAGVLAVQLDKHRPSRGPLATSPIAIVLTEYTRESGKLVVTRTHIMVATPQ